MVFLQKLNGREIPVCLLFNRVNHIKAVSQGFALISRLGNGVFWYSLMLVLPLLYGKLGLQAALHMLVVGLVGVVIYKLLKTKTHRVRPYHYNSSIFQNVAALDQFSFPSGHTLHAVSFTGIALHYFPTLAIVLLPFTLLVSLSRVVLGLHYPSDVLMGALIGVALAQGSLLGLA
ncbi:phosphatase PAP2 family protein [Thiolinea disciformis]|uniref:phosphatase PAP2 family protein n=1 Tax=Thiolinea disciformis TaxID=125614 RepID=UPI00036228CB|nr:phosphatase PAP2 family protein [Thiolinea disciformis]